MNWRRAGGEAYMTGIVAVESDVTGRQLYVPISHSAHQLICYDKSPHMYIYALQALNLEG
jgi:hypothetical protein